MKKMESGYMGLAGLSFFILFFLLSLSLKAQETLQHQLKEGETLYGIARQYKVPIDLLLKVNNISDPSKVRAGTTILVPHLYVVQKGDTLYGISRKWGIKVESLLAWNNLQPNAVIRPGDTLYIAQPPDLSPGPGTPQAIPAPSTVASPAPAKEKNQPLPSTTAPPAANGAPERKDKIQPTASPPTSTAINPNPEKTAKLKKEETPVQVKPVSGNDPARAIPPDRGTQAQGGAASSQTRTLYWPHPGNRRELSGKLEGLSFEGKAGDPVYSISSGKVAWVGPYRGFGKVVIIQSDQGYLYVYAGNESISVEPGELVTKGQRIGTLGVNPYNQTTDLYFLVYKDGKPVRPEEAPRI